MESLKGKVAVVTGASRGVGKGIALGLGEFGATVYVTGRTINKGEATVPLPGTINETAEEVNKIGGKGVPVRCDHRNDLEVKALFDRVLEEQGKIDILVNNAWAGYENIAKVTKPEEYIFETPFWKQPLSLWDDMQTVGLRSTYVASAFATPIMISKNDGLIVNISYYAGRRYMSNVAYGVCKAAVDRFTADAALELKDHGVTVISLYPGLVRMESVMRNQDFFDLSNSESPHFIGRCVAALADDRGKHSETGKILIAAEVAQKYGFTDIDGKQPKSLREQLW